MIKYVIKRVLWLIPVLLGVAFVIFSLMYFIPGDPAKLILGNDATEEDIEQKREELGLDDSYIVQLGTFFKDVFLHLDFGESYRTGIPVMDEIRQRFPKTLTIGIISLIIATFIGVPLGVTAAVHQDGLADRACMILALIGVSMPEFWFALILVIVFSLKLGWMPATGCETWVHYILPCLAGSVGGLAAQARQARSSMLEVIRSDYITTARAKGIPRWKVIYKHALPNALIPVLTVAGGSLALMFGGTVVLETVFSIPGVGTYMLTGINNRDYPIVRGCVILLAFAFSGVMLLVDLAYAFIDPKIKASYQRSGGKKRKND